MTVPLDQRAVRFPSTGHIWIPERGRRAAAAGIAMHSPCRPEKVLVQRVLYLGVRAFGSRLIPGAHESWTPPLPPSEWQDLLQQWRDQVGDLDNLVLYRRPQAGRIGFAALLLREGRGVGFARFHPDAARIEREFSIVQGVYEASPSTFAVARPIATGRLEQGAWLLNESLPNYPLGAVRRAEVRDPVADEIGDVLTGVLPRPDDIPDHWRPAHGDLAPWNLRTLLNGAVRVIDWEDARYAPAGVDRLYGALTAHTTFGNALPSEAPAEAIQWVTELVADRGHDGTDPADQVLLNALAAMTAR